MKGSPDLRWPGAGSDGGEEDGAGGHAHAAWYVHQSLLYTVCIHFVWFVLNAKFLKETICWGEIEEEKNQIIQFCVCDNKTNNTWTNDFNVETKIFSSST